MEKEPGFEPIQHWWQTADRVALNNMAFEAAQGFVREIDPFLTVRLEVGAKPQYTTLVFAYLKDGTSRDAYPTLGISPSGPMYEAKSKEEFVEYINGGGFKEYIRNQLARLPNFAKTVTENLGGKVAEDFLDPKPPKKQQ